MDEGEVKQLAKGWLEARGFKVKPEPSAPIDSENRELALDFHAYREKPPEIVWVECKGDVGLSQLLEGFVRTEFCTHYGGGLGLLALPTCGRKRLLKFGDFLSHSLEKVALLDAEEGEVYKLDGEKYVCP